MKVYVVEVYQALYGVYTTLELAIAACKEYNNHDYSKSSMTVNEVDVDAKGDINRRWIWNTWDKRYD